MRIEPAAAGGTPFLVVYRADGVGFAGLTRIASDHWSSAAVQTLHVQAGTTYYIQGGDRYAVWGFTSTFGLNMSVVLPPPNDNFADAIEFSSVPFSDSRDLTAAGVEPSEPTACGASFAESAWYAFTPATSGAYGAFGVSNVNVYTGTSLSNLTNVACADWPGLYFHGKKTVDLSFNYVFTSDDATLGKLPFKAVATIQGARDAVNSDNTQTSPPTRGSRHARRVSPAEKASIDRGGGRLAPRSHPELAEDRRHVVVDRARRQHEVVCDLRVPLPGGDEPEHVELTCRQLGRVRAGRGSRPRGTDAPSVRSCCRTTRAAGAAPRRSRSRAPHGAAARRPRPPARAPPRTGQPRPLHAAAAASAEPAS